MPAIRTLHWQSSSICLLPEPVTEHRHFRVPTPNLRRNQFHELVAAGCGNDLVREALSNLHTHVHLFRVFYHARATTEANDEHARIIDALRRRDANAAAEAMRSHIERSRDRFMTFFTRFASVS